MSEMKKELSVYEYLMSVLREIAGCAAQGAAYRKSWGDPFACNHVAEAWLDEEGPMRQERKRKVTAADFWTMTEEQQSMLGFGLWDDSGLSLIPLWALHYIADDAELTSISGQKEFKSEVADLDVRFGCIATGFAKPISKIELANVG